MSPDAITSRTASKPLSPDEAKERELKQRLLWSGFLNDLHLKNDGTFGERDEDGVLGVFEPTRIRGLGPLNEIGYVFIMPASAFKDGHPKYDRGVVFVSYSDSGIVSVRGGEVGFSEKLYKDGKVNPEASTALAQAFKLPLSKTDDRPVVDDYSKQFGIVIPVACRLSK